MRAMSCFRLLLPVLAGAWLAGCGFQLQGRQHLSPRLATVQVEAADRHSDFTRALRRSLTASGAKLVDSAGADGATVRIVRDRVVENVLSVDARNIPTDYELTYEVEVEVRAGGKELMAAEPFLLSRIYSYDERRQQPKQRERDVLREALARDMASVVLRRLASL
ncbi:MAG: LPS assembly lipoprotein LptE [Pseudomonadota bacterium]|nr:LPS assembly lipoprotein LptE [Pseudomonadota bacterium]